jgi:hypothetical protein
MLRILKIFFLLLLMPLLVACVTAPVGPSIMALPGTGKSFPQFRNDDYYCREFANVQSGGVTPNQAALTKGAGSAVIGTALGAAAGAAIGGGQGALIGAGAGLLGGGMVGASTSGYSGDQAQQRYDMGYIQCMYGLGHQVPVIGQFSGVAPVNVGNPVNTGSQSPAIPPPPPGHPPPPPPH